MMTEENTEKKTNWTTGRVFGIGLLLMLLSLRIFGDPLPESVEITISFPPLLAIILVVCVAIMLIVGDAGTKWIYEK